MADSASVGILKAMLTMDTASYEAGAKKAASANAALDKSINGLKQQTQSLTPLAERMVKGFGGDKLLYTANSLTAAVNKLGGAQKLTDAEQARVNKTLDAAITKYKALGQEAPKAMVDLEKATRRGAKETDTLKGSVVALGAAAGTMAAQLAGQALRGVINMGRQAVETAGQLVDLSAKTGLSTTTLQRMQAVANQSGGSLESFSSAAYKLGIRLAGGGDSVESAVGKLGLAWGRLETMSPDKRFEAVIRALSNMEDATERNRIGQELFGRSFEGIAAGIEAGYFEIADAANIATDAQLRALDAAGDRWQKAKDDFAATTQSILGNAFLAFDTIRKLNPNQLLMVAMGSRGLPLGELAQVGALRAEREAARAAIAKQKAGELAKTTQSEIDYTKALQEANAELKKLDAAERTQIMNAQKIGAEQDDVIDLMVRYGVSSKNAEAALKLLNEQTRTGEAATRRFADEQKKAAQHTQELIDRFSGAAALQAAREYESVLKAIGGVSRLTREEQELFVKAFQAVIEKYRLAGPSGAAIVRHFEDLLAAVQPTIPAVRGLASELFALAPAVDAASVSIDARLLPALHGLQALTDAADAAKKTREELAKLGMIAPEIVIENQNASADVAAHKIDLLKEKYREFAETVRTLFSPALSGLTDNLGSIIFGSDQAGANQAVNEARENFERIKRSGKATAEELTRAFRDWRQAEQQANDQFGSRWMQFWQGLKRGLIETLNQILSFFINNFLKGMLGALARTAFGNAVGNWIGSALGFGGGIMGAAAAAGGAGVLASSAVPASLAMAAVPGTAAAAGTTAAAAGAGGAGVAATGGTLAAIGGIAAAFALPFAAAIFGGFFDNSGRPATRQTLVEWGWLKPRTDIGQFTAPSTSLPSITGGAMSAPSSGSIADRVGPAVVQNVNVNISAWDSHDVRRSMPQIIRELKFEAVHNQQGMIPTFSRAQGLT